MTPSSFPGGSVDEARDLFAIEASATKNVSAMAALGEIGTSV
jgi:hypothetical protein